MARIIFFNSNTLHSKVTIPLALKLAEKGLDVYYIKKHPDFLNYQIYKLFTDPIKLTLLNRNSLKYVSKQHLNIHN